MLGIQYNPVKDIFTYRVTLDIPKTWIKRFALSTMARTYDPYSWVSLVIFKAKCFLQRLWKAEISWDEPLADYLLLDWKSFCQSLVDLNEIILPQCVLPVGEYKATPHGFCDASERGYAAVVYLRAVDKHGLVKLKLVLAKRKVGPLRTHLTKRKLELCGTVLLIRLSNHVHGILGWSMDIDKTFAWIDSQFFLCWLKTSVYTLEVFVANRVSQI